MTISGLDGEIKLQNMIFMLINKMKQLQKIGIILMLAVGIAAGCGKNMETQIAEQLELGNKYLAEMDYEAAIVAFDKVIALAPKRMDGYMGSSKSYFAQKKYAEAADILDKALQNVEIKAIVQTNMESVIEMYNSIAENYLAESDLENALKYYAQIEQLTPDSEEIKKKIDELSKLSQNKDNLFEMASSIVQESTYDFKDTEILSEDFLNAVKDLENAVFFVKDGNYIGVYPGGYIYYGSMTDGMRAGNGYWYYGNEKNIMIAHGNWENDKPNGQFALERITNPEKIDREPGKTYALKTSINGTVVDGVFNGSASITWIMEEGCNHEWNVAYNEGRLQPESADGKDAAYCSKCGANLLAGEHIEKVQGV